MRRPLLLLVNPRAGEGRQAGLLAGARALDEHFETTRLDASQDVEAALHGQRWPQHAGVVVFGGDGTVNGALPALLSTGLPLAVFPAGTVNDLARELGATADWPALLALLRDGVPAPMDVAVVNERPFAVYATLGLGAENSRYMHRTRHRFRARARFPESGRPASAAERPGAARDRRPMRGNRSRSSARRRACSAPQRPRGRRRSSSSATDGRRAASGAGQGLAAAAGSAPLPRRRE